MCRIAIIAVLHIFLFYSIKDAENARKEAENHLYGDFLEWYAETYPNAKKNIKGREKKESGKD